VARWPKERKGIKSQTDAFFLFGQPALFLFRKKEKGRRCRRMHILSATSALIKKGLKKLLKQGI